VKGSAYDASAELVYCGGIAGNKAATAAERIGVRMNKRVVGKMSEEATANTAREEVGRVLHLDDVNVRCPLHNGMLRCTVGRLDVIGRGWIATSTARPASRGQHRGFRLEKANSNRDVVQGEEVLAGSRLPTRCSHPRCWTRCRRRDLRASRKY
jgi:hypothetical protein